MPQPQKMGTILFVPDNKISPTRKRLVSRIINGLRKKFRIEFLPEAAPDRLAIQKFDELRCDLILVPWHTYFEWTRVEAHLGANRNSGPTLAGYFAESLPPEKLPESPPHNRCLLFDFGGLEPGDLTRLLVGIIKDQTRVGITPLIAESTLIYQDSWGNQNSIGERIDAIFGIPELSESDWRLRAPSIRIILIALWGILHRGDNDSSLAHQINGSAPKAHLQVAFENSCFLIRLCFSRPRKNLKESILGFWPSAVTPGSPGSLLMNHADFFRLNLIADSNDVEFVVGLTSSAPCLKQVNSCRNMSIDTVSPRLVTEMPSHPPDERYRHIASPQPAAASRTAGSDRVESLEQSLAEAQHHIHRIKKELKTKDDKIQELKFGGVGVIPQPIVPEVETLLDAFQERLFQNSTKIESLENEIARLEDEGQTPAVIPYQKKLDHLKKVRMSWIVRLSQIIELIRKERKKAA